MRWILAALLSLSSSAATPSDKVNLVVFMKRSPKDDEDYPSEAFSQAWTDLIKAHMAIARGDEAPPEVDCATDHDELEPGRAGGKVKAVYIVVDAKGRQEPCTFADEPILVVPAQGLQIEREKLPPGTYQVGYLIKDFGGRITEKVVPIRVK